MPKQIILILGLLIAVTGRVSGQDAAAPLVPTDSSAATNVSNDLFVPAPSPDNWWINAEYLFGWIEGTHLPPLVTTSPTGTDQSVAGVLGEPTTSVLLGGNVNMNVLSGFRIGGGYIYDQAYGQGIEASFRFLPGQSSSFLFSSDDNDILARPYTDATNGDPAAVLVAFPGSSTGTITVEAKSDSFYDANLDLSERIWESDGGGLRVDTLFGYRFASFSDSLRISQHIDSLTMPGTSIDSVDNFGAKNTFHGLDLGLRANYAWSDRLSLDLLTKLAVGNIHRTVDIRGEQVTRVTGDPDVVAAAGVYALSSNIGEHRRNNWTVLPEIGANLGWMFRSNMRLRFGYSALYLTDIARADNQIDSTVNPNLFPPAVAGATPLRPEFKVRDSNIWVQTLNIGLDVTF